MSFDYSKFYEMPSTADVLEASCRICNSTVKFTKKTKYNLQQHIKVKHETSLKEYEDSKKNWPR